MSEIDPTDIEGRLWRCDRCRVVTANFSEPQSCPVCDLSARLSKKRKEERKS